MVGVVVAEEEGKVVEVGGSRTLVTWWRKRKKKVKRTQSTCVIQGQEEDRVMCRWRGKDVRVNTYMES